MAGEDVEDPFNIAATKSPKIKHKGPTVNAQQNVNILTICIAHCWLVDSRPQSMFPPEAPLREVAHHIRDLTFCLELDTKLCLDNAKHSTAKQSTHMPPIAICQMAVHHYTDV